jgi:hypothetical protein
MSFILVVVLLLLQEWTQFLAVHHQALGLYLQPMRSSFSPLFLAPCPAVMLPSPACRATSMARSQALWMPLHQGLMWCCLMPVQ